MADAAYLTIADDYARRIRNGTLPGDAQLPSHAELAERHGVSRSVIRQAIQVLCNQQLVRTVPRRGTFVVAQTPVSQPDPLQLDDDVDEIRSVAHPIRRAQLAANLITHYQLRIAELSGIRQTAIEDAHDHGMSIADIGERLGLSNGRIG
ncbi:winged helix-turn-helix domain-containing protein [Nocardia sp. NPDC051052]|uniref:winged helix-turn-helix domain-containing protein n=1 Tax=Nocardia sp. NPDC051052 TaxID=3364322 RepID=UPI0037A9984C